MWGSLAIYGEILQDCTSSKTGWDLGKDRGLTRFGKNGLNLTRFAETCQDLAIFDIIWR